MTENCSSDPSNFCHEGNRTFITNLKTITTSNLQQLAELSPQLAMDTIAEALPEMKSLMEKNYPCAPDVKNKEPYSDSQFFEESPNNSKVENPKIPYPTPQELRKSYLCKMKDGEVRIYKRLKSGQLQPLVNHINKKNGVANPKSHTRVTVCSKSMSLVTVVFVLTYGRYPRRHREDLGTSNYVATFLRFKDGNIRNCHPENLVERGMNEDYQDFLKFQKQRIQY